MGKKVIVAGHICLDITPAVQGQKVSKIDDLLKPGKLIEVGSASVSLGGCVSNTGLAMKVLGADVELIGKIGQDSFGELVLRHLKKHNAAGDVVQSRDDKTAYTVVLAIPGIDRIFLTYPGANETFGAEDIADEKLEGAALMHFGYPPLLARMYQKGGEELERTMRHAHELGAATSMDLCAVDPDGAAGKADWKAILARVLPHVDIFVPSFEEICSMLDPEKLDLRQKQAWSQGKDVTQVLDPDEDIRPLARQLMDMGAKIVLLKCGAPGLYCCTASKEVLATIPSRLGLDAEKWADVDLFERSYVPERILSGTGCGDTSIGGFLTAMLMGRDPEQTMHLAAATGACCITAYDAISGLKSIAQMEEKIAAGWEKV